MAAQQTHDVVEETDRVCPLSRAAAGCVPANLRAFHLGQDAVQTPTRGIVQIGEETVLEIEVVVGEVHEPARVHEEPGYGEHGLVVRCGRVPKRAQVPGFVDEAKLQIADPE